MRRVAWNVALGACAISVLYLIVTFFDRRDVMEVRNVRIVPTAVMPGGRFSFEFEARPLRASGCEGESIASVIDSSGKEHLFNRPIILDRKKDGWQSYSRNIESPLKAAPGEARYVRDIKHWCSPLQRFWPIREHREVSYTILPN